MHRTGTRLAAPRRRRSSERVPCCADARERTCVLLTFFLLCRVPAGGVALTVSWIPGCLSARRVTHCMSVGSYSPCRPPVQPQIEFGAGTLPMVGPLTDFFNLTVQAPAASQRPRVTSVSAHLRGKAVQGVRARFRVGTRTAPEGETRACTVIARCGR